MDGHSPTPKLPMHQNTSDHIPCSLTQDLDQALSVRGDAAPDQLHDAAQLRQQL